MGLNQGLKILYRAQPLLTDRSLRIDLSIRIPSRLFIPLGDQCLLSFGRNAVALDGFSG